MNLAIIIPVYNDWKSLDTLVKNIDAHLSSHKGYELIDIFVVNDYSSENPLNANSSFSDIQVINKINIIHLVRNLGHQKAIATGLAYVAQLAVHYDVVVMDSDGEDKPEDISKLIEASNPRTAEVIFAHRGRRSESLPFRFFYLLYKFLFRLLTGSSISFGNFCFIPHPRLHTLASSTEIWNHLSAGILKTKIPYQKIKTSRGKRYFGTSKMNFPALVLHGLSALSVHIDTISVRFLIACLNLILVAVSIILAVIYVKFFTPYATPGWSTTIVVGFSALIMQIFFISIFLVFVTLMHRTNKLFIPLSDSKIFIDRIETLNLVKR